MLIGADLLNLDKLRGLGTPVLSIGGAGTFDGIFMTGIMAVLLAGLTVTVLLAEGAFAAGLNLTSQRFTPYRTCVLSGTPATTTAATDASVRQGAATSNFGASTTNDIASGSAANRRLYVRFDLTQCSPAIASSAVIRLATLRMYTTALPAVCRTVDVFRVTATWTEAGITWNNQPFGTTINNPAIGSATDTYGAGTPVGCENLTVGSYLTGAVVTADVAAFVAGTATNFGWMLRDDVEGSVTVRTQTYSAKNLGTASQAPQLVITYVSVP